MALFDIAVTPVTSVAFAQQRCDLFSSARFFPTTSCRGAMKVEHPTFRKALDEILSKATRSVLANLPRSGNVEH